VLCLQQDVADRVLTMLQGALAELKTGNPAEFATDVGPLITSHAAAAITAHIAEMRAAGCAIHSNPLPPDCAAGNFIAPTIIELADIAQLKREVFGPVLHVLRYRRDQLDTLLTGLAATGYALTFGVHSRIDETIARAVAAAPAGNIYVNRTLIGAVVGVQPFGGHGLSGTGPKAGGPLYLRRLVAKAEPLPAPAIGVETELPGPVGERNTYRLEPRGTVLCVAASPAALAEQHAAAHATGNRITQDPDAACDAVLFDGPPDALRALAASIAARPGPIIAIHTRGATGYRLEALVRERAVSTNTTAAGGNASLMMIG
jgi:RHH-type proline utilization regulon transcriptional repressor/proline dehydrogenase/delta 1-pyrroline-5-carboxylate dehydrogenase